MSFSRIVILLSFLGAAAFGFLYYQESQKAQVLDEFLYELNGPKSIQALVQKSLELNELQERVSGSNFTMDENINLDSYIRSCAFEADAGEVVAEPNEDSVAPGVEDVIYNIKPQEGNNARFRRLTIANFAYKLESTDPRVRVTRLKLNYPSGREFNRNDAHVLHEADVWTWEVQIRVRRQV